MLEDNITACSNCTCPINYNCIRFDHFYNGKYTYSEEYRHNNDFTCDEHVIEDNNKNIKDRAHTLFMD